MGLQVPCAVCNATDTRPLVSKFGYEIARCTHCGLVYANPRMPAESILARYSADYFWNEYLPAQGVKQGVYDPSHFDARYGPLLALLREKVDAPGSMLEVGAGAGFFLKAAERAGWDVTGLEISAEAVSFARQELGLNVLNMPAEQLDGLDLYDAVVMLDVIEHLFEPHQVLEHVRRVLRPGGVLMVSTPNLNALSRIALGPSWAVLSPGEHLYYLTEKTLRAILEVTGFGRVEFAREHASAGLTATMNPGYTHAPHSLRTRLYWGFVFTLGPLVYRWIRARGWGDTLLCIAR